MNFTNENMCYILKEYLTHHYKYIEKYGGNSLFFAYPYGYKNSFNDNTKNVRCIIDYHENFKYRNV